MCNIIKMKFLTVCLITFFIISVSASLKFALPGLTIPKLPSLSVLTDEVLGDLDIHWDSFKQLFNKTYASIAHEQKARDTWQSNIAKINTHNSLGYSYKLHANHLSDLSLRQYLKQVVKLVKSEDRSHNHTIPKHIKQEVEDVPQEIDWRKHGFKPQIVSQKRCGGCYAFSVVHALQAQLFITKHKLMALSEQQVIDCSGPWGNYGCGGGSLRSSFRYMEAYGVMSNHDYPYEARKGKCRWVARKVKAKVSSWGIIPHGDEDMLERAVAFIGPVAISLNAAPHTFQLYRSGVYDDPECTDEHVNHAMVVIGYTKTHWILLNWWGTHWGESGYMKLKKGSNHCGIANFAAYVVMD